MNNEIKDTLLEFVYVVPGIGPLSASTLNKNILAAVAEFKTRPREEGIKLMQAVSYAIEKTAKKIVKGKAISEKERSNLADDLVLAAAYDFAMGRGPINVIGILADQGKLN